LGIGKMIFTTSFSKMNYLGFETVAKTLRTVARQYGLELEFQPVDNCNIKLVVSSEKLLSVDNVTDFIDKIHILYKSTDKL
jgi:hypothetical protein